MFFLDSHVTDEIHLPGIYVQRVVLTQTKDKKIEKLTLSKKEDANREKDIRDKIAKRVAKVRAGIGVVSSSGMSLEFLFLMNYSCFLLA